MSNILLIDTCTQDLTIAVISDGKVIDGTEKLSGTQHSQRLCVAVQNLLDKAAITFADIDCYACAIGPGSFTGIRIGVSTVKGYALAHPAPFVELNTLQCIAVSKNCNSCGSAIIDAGNGYYYASYGENAVAPCLIPYDDERAKTAGTAQFSSQYFDGAVALALDNFNNQRFSETLTPLYIRKSQAEENL